MEQESYKAEDSSELVWLRLNRLKSVKLCENLIRKKLKGNQSASLSDELINAKAIGLSSAIESAIGYWQVQPQSLNAKILSRYYFLLQMTIAEQVSNVTNTDSLKEVQKHTESGHGLATITSPENDFPNNFYVYPLIGGHFYSYCKSLGIDIKNASFSSRQRDFSKITEHEKLIGISDILRRVPEIMNVVEEHLGLPPLSFHVGHSDLNMRINLDKYKAHLDLTGRPPVDNKPSEPEMTTFVEFYSKSENVTIEYLNSLKLPITDLESRMGSVSKKPLITGKVVHASDIYWWQHLPTYSSSYATNTYAIPLWSPNYDSIIVNFAALYSLSIIVRYMPDLWYRLNSGDLNHIGSLLEYYVSVIDHTVPLQMLARIEGTSISIHSPGSFFGQI